MATVKQPNTTCDIYSQGTAPPLAPRVAGVKFYLGSGLEEAAKGILPFTYTHVGFFGGDVDIRDGYTGQGGFVDQDHIWVPDQNGTEYAVRFVERFRRGFPDACKRVFLDRRVPPWPTNEV